MKGIVLLLVTLTGALGGNIGLSSFGSSFGGSSFGGDSVIVANRAAPVTTIIRSAPVQTYHSAPTIVRSAPVVTYSQPQVSYRVAPQVTYRTAAQPVYYSAPQVSYRTVQSAPVVRTYVQPQIQTYSTPITTYSSGISSYSPYGSHF